MEFEPVSKEEWNELAQYCQQTLETLLNKMDFQATVQTRLRENENTLVLEISAPSDIGLIIGKDGNTLRALQTIVRVLVMKRLNKKVQILLDADNYLLKREESLKDTAYAALQRVEQTNRKVQLKPMNSVERRIIHMALADEPNVHTYSIGEGADRRVVIAPGQAREYGAERQDEGYPSQDAVATPAFYNQQ